VKTLAYLREWSSQLSFATGHHFLTSALLRSLSRNVRVSRLILVFTPQYDLRISYLLTSYLFSIWLVCEYHYTRAECLRLNQFEFLLLALIMKKPLPVSYYNGEDHETVFINEILLHERVNELNAPKGDSRK